MQVAEQWFCGAFEKFQMSKPPAVAGRNYFGWSGQAKVEDWWRPLRNKDKLHSSHLSILYMAVQRDLSSNCSFVYKISKLQAQLPFS